MQRRLGARVLRSQTFCHETDEEFETYLALLKEVRAHGGYSMELITAQYILQHKGEGYYWNLGMSLGN